jgi:hypothetical protein
VKHPFRNGHPPPPDDLSETPETVAAKAAERAKGFHLDSLPGVWDMNVEIEWLIQEILVLGAFTLITGESGIGKSTFALALAGAVAQGQRFLGFTALQERVLYVDGENPAATVKERLQRLSIPKLDNLDIWGGWCLEHTPDGPFCAPVLEWARKHKGLVIYDSFIQFHPGSEQDASETRKYMDHYRKLVNLGCTVLLLHHVGKGEGAKEYRGSSDIKASSDQAFCLEPVGPPEGGRSSLRLKPFKTRMIALNTLLFEMNSKGFEVSPGSAPIPREPVAAPSQPNLRGIVELLVAENPKQSKRELIQLASARGVPYHRATAILDGGVRDGTIRVTTVAGKNQYRMRSGDE